MAELSGVHFRKELKHAAAETAPTLGVQAPWQLQLLLQRPKLLHSLIPLRLFQQQLLLLVEHLRLPLLRQGPSPPRLKAPRNSEPQQLLLWW